MSKKPVPHSDHRIIDKSTLYINMTNRSNTPVEYYRLLSDR